MMKTFEGINAYNQGESLTPTGRTRFAIEQNTPNLLRSVLFGQYGTKEGRQYVENLGKSKSQVLYETLSKKTKEEQLRTIQELKVANPALYQDFNNYMRDKTLNITNQEKNLRNLPVQDGQRVKALIKLLNSNNNPQEKIKLLQRFKTLGIITAEIEKQLNYAHSSGVLK